MRQSPERLCMVSVISCSRVIHFKHRAEAMMKKMVEAKKRENQLKDSSIALLHEHSLRSELVKSKEHKDEHLVIALFSRGNEALDVESLRNNAESYMRRKTEDKKSLQEFKLAAMEFEKTPRIVFILVDCSTPVGKELKEEFAIHRVPGLLVFVNGERAGEFDGSLSESGHLEQYLNAFMSPVPIFENEAEAYDFIWNLKTESAVMGFFSKNSTAEYEAFVALWKHFRGKVNFARALIEPPYERLRNVGSPPQVVIFRNFDKPAIFDGTSFTLDELVPFVNLHSANLVSHVDKSNFNVHVQKGLPLVVLWLHSSDGDSAVEYVRILRLAAAKYRNQLSFLYADGQANMKQALKFGISGEVFPALTLLDMTEFVHYVHAESEPITLQSIHSLCDGYISGSLDPNIRKEAPPSENDGPVKVLVYDTFSDVVLDKSASVLVAFCVPDDANCRMLTQAGGILEKLGERLAQRAERFIVAHMDMSKNDVPRHSIDSAILGYPTIKFFPFHDKKAVKFTEAQISVESLYKFVSEKVIPGSTRAQAGAGKMDLAALQKLKEKLERRDKDAKKGLDRGGASSKDEL